MKRFRQVFAWVLAFAMICTNVDYVKADTVSEGDIEIVTESLDVSVNDSEEPAESDASPVEDPNVSAEDVDESEEDQTVSAGDAYISAEDAEPVADATDERSEDTTASEKITILDQGTFCGMNWSINSDGLLLIEGEYDSTGTNQWETPSWKNYSDNIKSARVTATGVQSTRAWFEGCANLTSVNLSGFDASNVTDMSFMFFGCSALTKLDVSDFDASNVFDMSLMFAHCSALTELDVSGWKTDNIRDMSSMFFKCSALRELDMSGFKTDNVMNMSDMFSSCSALRELDLSGFKTDNVTSMRCMFDKCSALRKLDVSDFNTEKVTDMCCMFRGCSALTELDVSGFKTGSVTNMSSMFDGCSALTELDVSGFDTSNVMYMGSMFYNCYTLTELDVSGFKTDNVTDMSYMFYMFDSFGMLAIYGALTELDVSGFHTDNVTNMCGMFFGCSALTELDVSGFKTDNVTDMSRMFDSCSALTKLDVSGFKTDNVTNMSWMFGVCSALTELDVSGFETDNVTDMSCMFSACSALTELDVSGFKTDNVTDIFGMFNGCSALTELDVSGFHTDNVTNMRDMFRYCSALTNLDVSSFNTDNVIIMTDMFSGCSGIRKIKTFPNLQHEVLLPVLPMYDADLQQYNDYFPKDLTEGIWLYASEEDADPAVIVYQGTFRGMNWSINSNGLLLVEGEYDYEGTDQEEPAWLDYSDTVKSAKVTATGVKSTSYWFYWCENLTGINLSAFNTENVTDMSYMFAYCSALTDLNLSGFHTENVTDMSGMFVWCSALTDLDLSGFNTKNVTDMSDMFWNCSALTELDVRGFQTDNVTDMSFMFSGCNALTELDVSGFNTEKVTGMEHMFAGCSTLTELDVSGFNTENVTSMEGMFWHCGALTDLDLSGLNAENVTDMSFMFYNCISLTDLDLREFKTKNISDMTNMFAGCYALTYVDLRGFHTENVTDMSGMFYNCYALTYLDLSGFNTENVTDMSDMFGGCNSLTRLNIGGFNTDNVTDMGYMFWRCSSLKSLDVSGFHTENVTNMKSMFYNCSSLTELDVSGFNTENVTSMWSMFEGCTGIHKIKIFQNLRQEAALPVSPMYDEDFQRYDDYFPTGLAQGIWLYATISDAENPKHFRISAVAPQTYTGTAIKPVVEVYDGDRLLTEKVDYTVSYKNNTKVNNAAVEKTAPTITITGKGNYSDKVTVYFSIVAKDIADTDISAADIFAATTGKVQKPVPTVTWKNKKLSNKKDFEILYPDLKNPNMTDPYKAAGTYSVTIRGIGNFTGKRTIEFHITTATLMSKVKVKAIPKQTYTGSAITPDLTVTCGKATLTEGADYTVSYKDNIDAGKATVILTGMGAYAGTKEVTFQITGTSIAKAAVTGLTDKVYNGREQTQEGLRVELDGKVLKKGTDYEVSYTKSVNAGTATVTVTGIGGYSGKVNKKFKITAYDLSADESGLMEGFPENGLSVSYTKGGCTPEVTLSFNGVELAVKKDYTISYSNNKKVAGIADAKAPTITIKGKGNFKGTKKITFHITKRNLTEDPVDIQVSDMPFVNKAGKYVSKPVLTDRNGKKLSAGTDYEKTVTYTLVRADGTEEPLDNKSIPPVGSIIKVTVTGKGNYEGTMEATYRIAEKSFSSAKITIQPQTYTGSEVTLKEKDITVKIGKDTLTYGTDYVIVEGSYKNNVKKGTASVMIKGVGRYAGTKTVKFKITAKSFK